MIRNLIVIGLLLSVGNSTITASCSIQSQVYFYNSQITEQKIAIHSSIEGIASTDTYGYDRQLMSYVQTLTSYKVQAVIEGTAIMNRSMSTIGRNRSVVVGLRGQVGVGGRGDVMGLKVKGSVTVAGVVVARCEGVVYLVAGGDDSAIAQLKQAAGQSTTHLSFNLTAMAQPTSEDIVPSDFTDNSKPSIFNIKPGIQTGANFLKLVSWYDNEWGYSRRILDLLVYVAKNDAKMGSSSTQTYEESDGSGLDGYMDSNFGLYGFREQVKGTVPVYQFKVDDDFNGTLYRWSRTMQLEEQGWSYDKVAFYGFP